MTRQLGLAAVVDAHMAIDVEHARLLGGCGHPALAQRRETHRRDVDAGAQATLAMVRFDSTEWIGRLDTETLVVIPTKDQLVPVQWQYRLASLLRNPTIVEIAGARHELPWVQPERLTSEIELYLA